MWGPHDSIQFVNSNNYGLWYAKNYIYIYMIAKLVYNSNNYGFWHL